MPKGKFPYIDNGDVEIRLSDSPNDIYKLDSFTLIKQSAFFRTGLSQRWTTAIENEANKGKVKWKYDLKFEDQSEDGILVRVVGNPGSQLASESNVTVKVNNASRQSSTKNLWRSVDFMKRPSGFSLNLHKKQALVVGAHRTLLESFYHIVPVSHKTKMDEVSGFLNRLFELADLYCCNQLVHTRIEKQLNPLKSQILVQCKDDPATMLESAVKWKCAWIFKECATNLLGRSRRFFNQSLEKLATEELKAFLVRKRAEFVSRLHEVEVQLLTQAKFNKYCPTEYLASGDILDDTLTKTFFRHWLSDQMTMGKGSSLKPNYAKLYRKIYHGYWFNPNETRTFLYDLGVSSYIDMTSRARGITAAAKPILAPILEDNTLAKTTRADDCKPLTFTIITDGELPWAEELPLNDA